MTTTQRKPPRGKKAPPAPLTVLVDLQDATDRATEFVYAVVAALGLDIVKVDDEDAATAAKIQVSGNILSADNHQWHYPDHEAAFEHWVVTKCFPRVEHSTVWAVVQTGIAPFPLLSAAMAYAHADTEGALLIDADASGSLSELILNATDTAMDVLEFDIDLPSPHIYLLNAPTWESVTMMLHINRGNPLNSVLLLDTVHASRHHFAHTVIDCGADLFLAQRLATEGAQVIHVDDHLRPLYVNLNPYRQVDYYSHRIPEYGTRRDFEYIVNATRHRRSMRRWMQRGDAL